MKILEHGKFYYDTVNISCNKCNCKYEIKKEDIKYYEKTKKVIEGAIDCNWVVKYHYYSLCPECGYDNHLSETNYAILTTDILGSDDNE